MQKANKTLSVIIPAHKQARTIIRDLRSIIVALDNIKHPYEIILVIDGDLDQTYKKAKKITHKHLKIYLLKTNQGKGYAIRHGMTKAKGDYIAFLDAGMEIHPNAISMLFEHLKWYKADIVVGSKRHPVSVVKYPLDRKILSWGYYFLVWFLFQIKVKDTQTGIKIFRKHAIKAILPHLLIKKYAFDIEMLTVARLLGHDRIFEAPIRLEHRFESLTSAATWEAIYHMLYDTLAVFYRLRITRYYHKSYNL